jgi:hypothetical protein
MRFSIPVATLSLATVHYVSALNGAILRELSELADLGLNADGTPIRSDSPISTFSTSSEDNEVIVAEYVELPLDNFAKNGNFKEAGTFWNRYWVKEGAYRSGGPVFLYDVGEGDAEPYWRGKLQSESSWFMQMVEEYGGVGIVWEHRYCRSRHFYFPFSIYISHTYPTVYLTENLTNISELTDGNSTPGGIDIYTPPEIFAHLTTAQSLADINRFAKQFSRKSINHTLTPDTTPWIMVGGSYPAVRAAIMRDRYPDTIFAAFASSAPVEAKIDMSAYWDPIVRGMRKYGFGNCSRDIIEAVKYIDRQLDRKDTAKKIKKQFLGWGAENADNGDFAEALSHIFTTWQSYGMEGSPYSLRSFCDWIETDPGTPAPPPPRPVATAVPTAPGIYSSSDLNGSRNESQSMSASASANTGKKIAGADGWAKSKGVQWVISRWASWPYFVTMIDQYLDTNCSGRDDLEGDCRLDYNFTSPAGIAWSWQYCTEWGKFSSHLL